MNKTEQTAIINQEDVAVVKSKIENMRDAVKAITVSSQEELAKVSDHIADVRKMRKFIEQERDKYVKPAKEIIASAKDQYDPFIRATEEAEGWLKGKAQEYMLAEQKKEQAAKQKLAERVERGTMKPETAVRKMEEVQEAPKTVRSDSSKLTMKTVKDVRIIDQSKIPDEYYKPRELDMVKIKKVATAGVSIPGVEVFDKPQMSV